MMEISCFPYYSNMLHILVIMLVLGLFSSTVL
jgi:hypothetical protein